MKYFLTLLVWLWASVAMAAGIPANNVAIGLGVANSSFTGITGASGVLSTNGSSVPSISSTLPSGLNIPSPSLTGTPVAPTATEGTNTTQLATTAFVLANGGAQAGVIPASSFAINGNGSTDNCTAFAAINAAVSATETTVQLPPGIYFLACNITLAGTWQFPYGAMLKPASGFTITFAHMYQAGAYQIFDLYDPVAGTIFGGVINLPAAGTTDVWGEQFGMKGDFTTLHNEIGMQEAVNAVYPASLSENGGFIRLGTGTFQMCGHYTVENSTSVQGMGRGSTELLANSSCWNGDANMVVSVDFGSTAQFGCWHRDLNLNANSIAAITDVINAGSWQEDSGVERVLINNFMQNGITDKGFFGGAADFNAYDTEMFYSASATGQVAGILLVAGDTVNWTNVNLRTYTFAGSGSSVPTIGVYGVLAYGRLNINEQAVHCENVQWCFSLNDEATLAGSGLNGGPGTGVVVEIDPFTNGTTGTHNTGTPPYMSLVSVSNMELGGAVTLFKDTVNTVTIADQFGQPFIYPASTFTGTPTSSFTTRSGVVTHQ